MLRRAAAQRVLHQPADLLAVGLRTSTYVNGLPRMEYYYLFHASWWLRLRLLNLLRNFLGIIYLYRKSITIGSVV